MQTKEKIMESIMETLLGIDDVHTLERILEYMQYICATGSGSIERQLYKDQINVMIEKIENPRFIKMIYGFVKSAYREEKSRE